MKAKPTPVITPSAMLVDGHDPLQAAITALDALQPWVAAHKALRTLRPVRHAIRTTRLRLQEEQRRGIRLGRPLLEQDPAQYSALYRLQRRRYTSVDFAWRLHLLDHTQTPTRVKPILKWVRVKPKPEAPWADKKQVESGTQGQLVSLCELFSVWVPLPVDVDAEQTHGLEEEYDYDKHRKTGRQLWVDGCWVLTPLRADVPDTRFPVSSCRNCLQRCAIRRPVRGMLPPASPTA